MRRILSNLQFEYELATAHGNYPPQVGEVLQRFQFILRLLPGHQEAEPAGPGLKKNDTLTPWGVTPKVAGMAPQGTFPTVETVRRVNDKCFSHRLERELGIALPGSAVVENMAQLEEQVKACPHDWILKHPLGVSGRNRCLGRAGTLLEPQAAWAGKRLKNDGKLLFEPWVAERHDYSLHYEISGDREIVYLGRCELLHEQGGMYCGNEFHPGAAKPEVADAVVERVAQEGYWGPLSLDCFDGKLGGHEVSRPLVEINARYTFGRITLELGRWIPQGWHYLWWHPSKGPGVITHPPLERLNKPGWYSLPTFADPESVSRTLIAAAPGETELAELFLGY